MHATRSGIVCGCRQAKVSKFTTQITQELSGLGNCFKRIEGVCKLTQSCRCGHELRYALRTCRADRIRLEMTFLPDQAREEISRQVMAPCRLREPPPKARWRRPRGAGCRLRVLF